MAVTWSEIQLKRLKELDAPSQIQHRRFETIAQRNCQYQELEKQLSRDARTRLKELRDDHRRPALCLLESDLTETLTAAGFVQVTTPIILSRTLLAKMTIDTKHPLYSQVYWLDKNRCLRPMLAPHLYYVLKDLLRLWEPPVRIFEVGPCFRRESQGAQHSTEFTMLNLVEMGLPETERQSRLEELASRVTRTAGIPDYRLECEKSAVYGETIDVIAGEQQIEVGSAAMGPHPLDTPWRITESWVGIGFGLERLLMAKENSSNLAKMGRSLAYLDGTRLNV